MKIILTGCAGFIGMHLAIKLLEQKHVVIGIDNLNEYYDVSLKKDRVLQLKKYKKNFTFYKLDLDNLKSLKILFKKKKPDLVINLAAQAGVRYSLTNPHEYIKSNIRGFLNVLECMRDNNIKNIIYASSSSVYGLNKKIPFAENHKTENPISIYAVSKKTNELMANTYSKLFGFKAIGLRFFTVYGPYGRPDMALFKFTKKILNRQKIEVFNNGKMIRDFTYIDDVIESIYRVVDCLLNKKKKLFTNVDEKNKNHHIFNVGNSKPVKLTDYIKELEKYLKIKANKKNLPMQKGDVYSTYSNSKKLKNFIKYAPTTSVNAGISKFVDWYKDYYKINKL